MTKRRNFSKHECPLCGGKVGVIRNDSSMPKPGCEVCGKIFLDCKCADVATSQPAGVSDDALAKQITQCEERCPGFEAGIGAMGAVNECIHCRKQDWEHTPSDDALRKQIAAILNRKLEPAQVNGLMDDVMFWVAAALTAERQASQLQINALREELGKVRDAFHGQIDEWQAKLAAQSEVLIRCHDCGGFQMWKKIPEGYEVYHDCFQGKHTREMLKAAESTRNAAIAHETQQSVSDWATQTFGEAGSNLRVAVRANEEMSELLRALSTDGVHPKAAEEVADIFIVLYRVAQRLGVNVADEIDKKMAINRAREWNLDGTGHGYHK